MAKRANKKKENKKQSIKTMSIDDALKMIEGYDAKKLYDTLNSHLAKRESLNQSMQMNEAIIAKVDEQLRKKL